MKLLAGFGLALFAATSMAKENVTFSQYKVSTEVAADLARQCRVEVQQEYGERCDRFYSHMENHMALYNQFTSRIASEGDNAYGSADSVELEMHQKTVSRLMESMQYINTMSELHFQ
ncbi:hypothetical protein [Halomonas llamarensis]|uniref:DUF1311 domain-containing protein n=1 Tax=Halomonas llamarensis TaxID=2945104 RepID=A0ABT0SV43_9GAMM|nr:hypothetical protein [Halomonas llamarensis]MCL7931704.1 hypothetical protein [Halomonas llamarensis]